MTYIFIFLLLIASYLLGSIPGGYLLTKIIKKDDIRNYGSKSTGATNTTRVLGWKLGVLAALIDITKGIVIISILYFANLEQFYIIDKVNFLPLYGLIAVLGHIFPIYLKFRGGKAVATSFGVVLFLTPIIGLIGITAFIIILLITKYVSVSSMLSSSFLFLVTVIIFLIDPELMNLYQELVITYFLLVTIIILRHIPNMKRLINKEEPKIRSKKAESQ